MSENRIYSFIGLARKAGKVAAGDCAVESAIKRGKAACVILSEDASPNTEKKYLGICGAKGIPIIRFGARQRLGEILGKEMYSVIAVTDMGFASRIEEMIQDESNHDKLR
ncbi:L7Ae/L30e/S12e/Gadd45 family ribosomal protein [Thermoclostridium caenicola]|uniref:LSU ribosomal protein L7AE n=1 Tax=Thermoclostridium caenicola TaxID=659425 RepID=A0A1M6FL10_9FIRM|nr:ribosomal L7Ae/L30e/S12e/Gadd45 family protein [Thermoclostridium caenicola]SHI98329.1 LSU ribosomal protein L7AE [Thermoclostridium caenicola]HOL84437.1 ribosomal L7Ae/L30e/S12e/Gadd45 family protein [Thermoclostridium caenicola]HPO76873.1 ribosomal L7Ae/L30e/S12e/Gadd45 family protein [Thermoclostridium caenicola]HPU21995.1 ribosomal L7Ae/L30e/S12e/Gadd45 family protein [Thermoclostridium caenicola]